MKKIQGLVNSGVYVLFLFLNLSLSKKNEFSVCLYGIESNKLPFYPRNENHIVTKENKIAKFNEKEFTENLYKKLTELPMSIDSSYGFSCKSAFVFEIGGETEIIAIGTNCKVKINNEYYKYDFEISSFILSNLIVQEKTEKIKKILPNDNFCNE